jgi:uncharacterized protein
MRKVNVKVVARAKRSRIVVTAADCLKVYVTAPAVDGKANQAVIVSLADWFQVKKPAVRIVRGLKSREKIVEIKDL